MIEDPPPYCRGADDGACAAASRAGQDPCAEECLVPDTPYAPPPAVEQGRPHTGHRYPAPTWTIGDALRFLKPTPRRRTLSRWLTELTPVGERALPQGGPPAKTYLATEVMQRHARWCPESDEDPGNR